jgi:hypothetical protein
VGAKRTEKSSQHEISEENSYMLECGRKNISQHEKTMPTNSSRVSLYMSLYISLREFLVGFSLESLTALLASFSNSRVFNPNAL